MKFKEFLEYSIEQDWDAHLFFDKQPPKFWDALQSKINLWLKRS